ncbi:TetR/AcrR family transcriptional regulator [Aquabacterium sp.]|uniref:TetR/AcrR family transcriptional regulator n=1 Tax=Aquabacterium sp. TaxID=1872578 RepID=UPI0024887B9B|nr:TetR/AcrR family transcriptional regulator [Aquabacterium sp.]MDI1348462.1 TetR/AcrR family transcriptional regulator [Aquabacterium sp.]
MSYPKKLSREAIVEAALAHIEAHGVDALSMRTLATDLGVTPNALYRYFPSKTDLSFALADEAGRILLSALQAAAQGLTLLDAVRATAQTYLHFARTRPALYAVKMSHCKSGGEEPPSHAQVWDFVLSFTADLHTPWDREDLALSLWAALHGLVELDRADMLDGRDAQATLNVMLDVLLAGLASGLPAFQPSAQPSDQRPTQQPNQGRQA